MARVKLFKLLFLVLLVAALCGPFGAEQAFASGCPNYSCPLLSTECYESGACCCFYDCGGFPLMYCFHL